MKKICVIMIILAFLIGFNMLAHKKKSVNDWITVIEDTCIYDNNNHAAFTSLEEWQGNLLVAFREAGFHRETSTDKGKIRILEKKKQGWKPQHTFYKENYDLRDPYLLKWNDKLMLYTSGYYSELTDTGWTELKPIIHDAPFKLTIWKIRINNNVAYGIGHGQGKWPLLLKSLDGKKWNVISEYKLGGYATEADMVFMRDTMYICMRIDTPIGSNSMWGKSVYPYINGEWSLMNVSLASPEMIIHSDDMILLAGREYDYHRKDGRDERYVSLFTVNKNGLVVNRHIVENKGGDQGYASFSRGENDIYYMSYYAGISNTSIRMMTFKINN